VKGYTKMEKAMYLIGKRVVLHLRMKTTQRFGWIESFSCASTVFLAFSKKVEEVTHYQYPMLTSNNGHTLRPLQNIKG